MTIGDSTAAHLSVEPRSRAMESWRARLGVFASRGEVEGPGVEECPAVLSVSRLRTFLIREMQMSVERADTLIDQMLDGQVAAS